MKKINLLFTAILLLCCVGTVKAEEVTIDGIKYDVATETKLATVISGGNYSGDIVIPSEITHNNVTHSVTSIGDWAFYYCEGLTSVTIPNSVTSIGEYAFDDCSGLTSVTIGNGVTSIGDWAFSDCTGLTSIEIGNSVTSIGDYAFSSCSGLTSIEIPNSVTSIGEYAFNWCDGLTSITIPNSVTSIGNNAFKSCSGLTSITIGNGVTSIGDYAFNWCDGLTSITIPNSVTSIGNGAFSYCFGLTSIEIPNSVTSIGDGAFSGCSGLTSIIIEVGNPKYDSRENCNAIIETESNTLIAGCMNTIIPNSVTSIGNSAFYGCKGLTSITIPNSVTSIGNYAFYYCSKLTSITIPNSVTSIGNEAFYYCSGLTRIEIPNSVTSIGSSAFEGTAWYNNQPDGVVYAGNVLYKYKGTMPSNTSVVVKEGTLGIADEAFNWCYGLTSVTIPNSVKSIGEYAFSSCSGLTSIEIPNSVTSIGNSAFYSCSGLTSIEIPNSVTSIGDGAFNDCSGLTSVELGNSVTSIGEYAFDGCTALKTVINNSNLDIEKGSTSNGYVAYYADEVIANEFKFELVDGVYTLVKYRGKGAKQEETTTFDSWTSTNKGQGGSTSSYKYTFDATAGSKLSFDWSVSSEANYDELHVILDGTTVLINSGEYSGNYEQTFTVAGSYTLEVIYTKDGSVDSNNDEAKIYNVKLTKTINKPADVVLPDNYEGESYVIGESAFENNEYVASVTIPECVEMICDKAFSGCINLENIVIPNSVTSIGNYAFNGCTGLTSITSHIPADALFALNTNAFNGVNKNSCTLYVPYGAKETYAATAGWNEFTNIVEMAPESQPGDINKDGEVNVGDFAALANIIFNSESIDDAIKSVSDINADGEVNVGDFAALVNLIFNSGSQASPQRAATRAATDETTFYIEPFSITAGETKVIPVLMENPGEKFSQLQFDITLPEGLEIPEYFDEEQFDDVKDIKRGSRTKSVYSIQTQPVGEALRVLCITQNSKAFFTGESGDVLLITVKAADDIAVGDVEIKITNTVLSRQDGTTYKPADCTATVSVTEVPTGIDEVKEQRAESKDVYYDLSGRAVENPTKGINILNGKKILVK